MAPWGTPQQKQLKPNPGASTSRDTRMPRSSSVITPRNAFPNPKQQEGVIRKHQAGRPSEDPSSSQTAPPSPVHSSGHLEHQVTSPRRCLLHAFRGRPERGARGAALHWGYCRARPPEVQAPSAHTDGRRESCFLESLENVCEGNLHQLQEKWGEDRAGWQRKNSSTLMNVEGLKDWDWSRDTL